MNKKPRAGEHAQWVKTLLCKASDLSSILGAHVEEQGQTHRVLWPPYVHLGMLFPIYTLIIINIYLGKILRTSYGTSDVA